MHSTYLIKTKIHPVTELHTAAYKGYLPLVKVYLQHGVNLYARDVENGRNVFHFAAMSGKLDLLKFLAKYHQEKQNSLPCQVPIEDPWLTTDYNNKIPLNYLPLDIRFTAEEIFEDILEPVQLEKYQSSQSISTINNVNTSARLEPLKSPLKIDTEYFVEHEETKKNSPKVKMPESNASLLTFINNFPKNLEQPEKEKLQSQSPKHGGCRSQ